MSTAPSFSANLGFLWKREPFLTRIARAKAAGFAFLEFHDDAQREDVDAVREALAGLSLVGLNTRMGETSGAAALPDQVETARADIAAAATVAEALDAQAVHVVAGRAHGAEARAAYVARLTEASEALAPRTVLIEPISEGANAGYFLRTVDEARAVIQDVGKANVKILFDCFHVAMQSGDVEARFRTALADIGHVQIASVPDRAEPDHGDLDYARLLPAMRDAGYAGPFGCEYTPAGAVEDGLAFLTR